MSKKATRIAFAAVVLAVGGAAFAAGRVTAPSSSHPLATTVAASTTPRPPTTRPPATTATSTASDYPFSVMFGTAPCFNPLWNTLAADKWSLRDAVTGATYGAGVAYQGRCGFSVQFRLPASTYSQVTLVYPFDPNHQLAGLNQSNGGDPNVFVSGDGGPYKLTGGAVIPGPTLTDCQALPTSCG